MTEGEKVSPPTDAWAIKVCKIGQGAECCRYLTFNINERRWSCQKDGQFRDGLDHRVAAGKMVAIGDNCEGRAE